MDTGRASGKCTLEQNKERKNRTHIEMANEEPAQLKWLYDCLCNGNGNGKVTFAYRLAHLGDWGEKKGGTSDQLSLLLSPLFFLPVICIHSLLLQVPESSFGSFLKSVLALICMVSRSVNWVNTLFGVDWAESCFKLKNTWRERDFLVFGEVHCLTSLALRQMIFPLSSLTLEHTCTHLFSPFFCLLLVDECICTHTSQSKYQHTHTWVQFVHHLSSPHLSSSSTHHLTATGVNCD